MAHWALSFGAPTPCSRRFTAGTRPASAALPAFHAFWLSLVALVPRLDL